MSQNKRSSVLRFGVIAAFLIILGAYYATTDSVRDTTSLNDGSDDSVDLGQMAATQSRPAPAQTDVEQAMQRLKNRAGALAAQRVRPQREAPSETLGFPRETVTLAQEIFDEMWAVRGLVHTQEQRIDASKRLLAAPRALELMYHTATDPDFARRAFGEQQAEARYYSITVLEQAAKAGPEQQELLKNAVAVVRRGLTSEDGFDAGRGEDFRGLLSAYTGLVEPNSLDAEAMRTLGYEENLSREMKQIYYETVFSVLWKREGIEFAEARFKEIFTES